MCMVALVCIAVGGIIIIIRIYLYGCSWLKTKKANVGFYGMRSKLLHHVVHEYRANRV